MNKAQAMQKARDAVALDKVASRPSQWRVRLPAFDIGGGYYREQLCGSYAAAREMRSSAVTAYADYLLNRKEMQT